MALAIDGSSPAIVTQTNAATATLTTASFTPPTGSVLLVLWSCDALGTPSAPTITDNLGTPLTYTRTDWQSVADSPAAGGQAAAWTAPVASSAAMTVTVTSGAASGERIAALKVVVLTGADTVTPVGAHGKSGSKSAASIAQSYTAQATGGWGFISVCDFDQLGAETAGTGCTLIGSANVSTHITYAFNRRTTADDTNAASNTLNLTLPGTSTNLAWVYIEIMPAATTTATYPPQRARSREAPPLRVAKTRQTTPVRSQVNPPYPTQEVDQTRRLRGMLARRGEIRSVTPPQFNPPFPFTEIHPTRQLRGLLPRRGRLASPVPPQIVLTPPPYPPQVVRVRPKMLRWFRGREAQPVPPPVVVTPPAFVPDRPRRTRLFAWVRREHPSVPLALASVPAAPKRDRPNLPALRRPKMAVPVPPQPVPPTGKPARHPAALRLRHGGFIAVPLKQQLPPVNPAFVPTMARRRVTALPVRRGRYVFAWPSVCDCATHRRNAGVTGRPSTGTTARPGVGVTGRPGGGTTTRPVTGVTARPCNC